MNTVNEYCNECKGFFLKVKQQLERNDGVIYFGFLGWSLSCSRLFLAYYISLVCPSDCLILSAEDKYIWPGS